MKHYTDSVTSPKGEALARVQVRVTVAASPPGSGALAELYADNDKKIPAPNPVSTDARGQYHFYVADGRYDLSYSGAGISPLTIADVEIAESVALKSSGRETKWTP